MSPSKNGMRPPPITIPSHRQFLSERRIAIEQELDVTLEEPESGKQVPAAAPLSAGSDTSQQKAEKQEGGDKTGLTTWSGIMDAARSSLSPRKISPRKSDGYASTASGKTSKTRSKHSSKSRRSDMSQQPEQDKTSRGMLESRTENKYFHMMGQIPPTPEATGAENHGVTVARYDFTEAQRRASEEQPRSPKKKLFGVNLPTFRTLSTTPADGGTVPPMPKKAAKVLGTSPTRKHGVPRSIKGMPRSDTSKSLPGKLHEQRAFPTRANMTVGHKRSNPSPLTNSNTVNHTPARANHVAAHGQHVSELGEIDDIVQVDDMNSLHEHTPDSKPPTPPEKDTPKEAKGQAITTMDAVYANADDWPLGKDDPHMELDCDYEQQEDDSISPLHNLHVPNFAWGGVGITATGGVSPKKFCPTKDGKRIQSCQAEFDCESESAYSNREGNYTAPLEGGGKMPLQVNPGPQGRWSEDGKLPYGELPTRFYTPSNFSVKLDSRPSHNVDRGLFYVQDTGHSMSTNKPSTLGDARVSENSGESISVVFEGSPLELDASGNRIAAETKTHKRNVGDNREDDLAVSVVQVPSDFDMATHGPCDEMRAASLKRAPHPVPFLQPEHSSSRLTDILGDISPSRTSYNNFAPDPTALPSPLHQQPVYQAHPPGFPGTKVPAGIQSSIGSSGLAGITVPTGPNVHVGTYGIGASYVFGHARGTLEDGSSILGRFAQMEAHLDMLGKFLYDEVQRSRDEQAAATAANSKGVVSALEAQVADIKGRIDTLAHNVERISDQSHNLGIRLEQLATLVKAEVVKPMVEQARKTADTENEVMTLKKQVEKIHSDMKTVKSSLIQKPIPPTPPSFALPSMRSQPSLTSLFESPARSGSVRPPLGFGHYNERSRLGNAYAPYYYGDQQDQQGRQGQEGRDGETMQRFYEQYPFGIGGGPPLGGAYYPGFYSGMNEANYRFSNGSNGANGANGPNGANGLNGLK